jgi:protein CLEC16A
LFSSINNRGQLTSSLEEYLDHIHYLHDIFLLHVDSLNNVLKEQLMNRLLIPVYIFSLIKREKFSRVKVNSIIKNSIDCFIFSRIHELYLINYQLFFFSLK